MTHRRCACVHARNRGRSRQRALLAGVCLGVVAAVGCSSTSAVGGTACNTDSNGVSGGSQEVLLTVSDTAFSVGASDAGSMEPNITTENLVAVRLTLTNLGSKPHDFLVQCQPTPNDHGCPMQSCFPVDADIPPLQPGQSATAHFETPVHEGPYPFISDVAGDTLTSPDGGPTGLVGEFVVM